MIGRDVVSPIRPAQRIAPNRLVIRQILRRDQTSVVAHIRDDALSEFAGVENIGAAFGDQTKRVGVFRILDAVAHLLGGAVSAAIEAASGRRLYCRADGTAKKVGDLSLI